MVNQSFLIYNINAVKDGFSINAKVVRLWRQYYYGGDTLASMDMILMDQQGSRISASISHKMVYQFESLLKEGGSVNLSNFYVAKNNADYRVANHAFKINFHRKTKVKSIPSVFPSKYGFAFVPFTEFLEDKVVQEQAVGLYKGTILLVLRCGLHVVEATIMSGLNAGHITFIPRLPCLGHHDGMPLHECKRQFPLVVCFQMMTNNVHDKER